MTRSSQSEFLTPNAKLPIDRSQMIIIGWTLAWIGAWTFFRPQVFPTPLEVLRAFPNLWFEEGLGQELATSFLANAEALLLSTLISLPLAYLSVVPAVRPLAVALSKLRFLSPAIFFLPLLFLTSSSHAVKIWMLTLGESFYLITTMLGVVQGIPDESFDDARTLRMSEWTATWYVVVRGTVPQALDALRDNAAMGWAAIMFVEGFVRSEGGVGVLMLNQERHMNFSVMYAIAFAVLLIGLLQDYVLVSLRNSVCPYAEPAA
jgi:NitT/TauT family transport system permease protein